MSKSTKTTVANVLIAFTCCTVALLAFFSHRARSEDRWVEHRASINHSRSVTADRPETASAVLTAPRSEVDQAVATR